VSTAQPTLYAAVDVGTVSTRLAVAAEGADGPAVLERDAVITDLGEGVDAGGRLSPAAIGRTRDVLAGYVARVRDLAARHGGACLCVCTATSASRDAANADEFTGAVRDLGLLPQVIDGGVEASLALLGVTADFGTSPVVVADIGGGSTELALGRRDGDGGLVQGPARSHDVGCRRVAERFFAKGAPAREACREARAFVRAAFAPYLADLGEGARARLVCVGGTATSLVAVARGLVPYDPAAVHLARLGRPEVHALTRRLLGLAPEELRALPGLQPKRAAVIAQGALILDELMEAGGWDAYTASESDSLQGLLTCARAAARGEAGPLSWRPVFSIID
jgi:exopolyphosphatase/guanosine-5'-triphosphate,3'-diphosphate pyrophosphatase